MSRRTSASSGVRPRTARLLRDDRGATLVEFTVVIGLLFAITFAIVEFALVLWEYNSAEKATQVAVRYAVESDPVAEAFVGYNGVTDDNYSPGQSLDVVSDFTVSCSDPGGGVACTCASGSCTSSGGYNFTDAPWNQTTFDEIVARVRQVYPQAPADSVVVEYAHVGLGFAGRPGLDIVPAVTVRLQGLTYDFVTLGALTAGALQQIDMPLFTATLTGEDLDSCAPGVNC